MTDSRYRKRLLFDDEVLEKYIIDQKNVDSEKNNFLDFQEYFGNVKYKRIELEIGCGNGHFIHQKCYNNPETFFIANEIKATIIKKAALKIHKNNLQNAVFLRGDINYFIKYFGDASLDCVYINFPDPWPKTRHIKRRLINLDFLKIIYEKIKFDGKIFFVSDSKNYIDYSIRHFKEFGKFKPGSENFGYKNEINDYPQSLFESLFRKKNIPIYYTFYIKK